MHSIDNRNTKRIQDIVNKYYCDIMYRYASLYALFSGYTDTIDENPLDEFVESISLFATLEACKLYSLLQ